MLTGMVLLPACRPLPLYFEKVEGPPTYQLGYQDGCDSSLSKQSALYRMAHGFRRRAELMENRIYFQGWLNGMVYCQFPTSGVHVVRP